MKKRKLLRSIVAMTALVAMLAENTFSVMAAVNTDSLAGAQDTAIEVETQSSDIDDSEIISKDALLDQDEDIIEETPSKDTGTTPVKEIDINIGEDDEIEDLSAPGASVTAYDDRIEATGMKDVTLYVNTDRMLATDSYELQIRGNGDLEYSGDLKGVLSKDSSGIYHIEGLGLKKTTFKVAGLSAGMTVEYTVRADGDPQIELISKDEPRAVKKLRITDSGFEIKGSGYDSINLKLDAASLPVSANYDLYIKTKANVKCNGDIVDNGVVTSLIAEETSLRLYNLDYNAFTIYIEGKSSDRIFADYTIDSEENGVIAAVVREGDKAVKIIHEDEEDNDEEDEEGTDEEVKNEKREYDYEDGDVYVTAELDDPAEILRLQRSAAHQRAVHVGLFHQAVDGIGLDAAAVKDTDCVGHLGVIKIRQRSANQLTNLLRLLESRRLTGADGPNRLVGDDAFCGGKRAHAGKGLFDLRRDKILVSVRLTRFQRLPDANDGNQSRRDRRFGPFVDGLVRIAEILAPLGMADDDVLDAGVLQHGGGQLARISAAFFPMDILGAHADICGRPDFFGRQRQRRRRRANDNGPVLHVFHQRQKLLQKRLRLGVRLVHFPVARDDGLALPRRRLLRLVGRKLLDNFFNHCKLPPHLSAIAASPGSVFPSRYSSVAPPPVEIWEILSESPVFFSRKEIKVPRAIVIRICFAASVIRFSVISDFSSNSSLPKSMEADSGSGFSPFFSIRKRPMGPPSSAPDTSPKVAAARAMVLALSSPASSRIGAQVALVPCPPTMGMEPVARPTSGLIPITLLKTTPRPFCSTTSIWSSS